MNNLIDSVTARLIELETISETSYRAQELQYEIEVLQIEIEFKLDIELIDDVPY